MPYHTLADLPAAVKKKYTSTNKRKAFLKAFNSALKEYGDESTAYAVAHKAAKGAKRMFDFTKIQEQIRAFDPDYAFSESMDAMAALEAMCKIISLMQREAMQGEEQHVKDLVDIYTAIDNFVDEELAEALSGDGSDGEEMEEPDDMDEMGMRASPGEKSGSGGHGGYLVTDENGKKHLPTKKNGKLSRGLAGSAWAALHGGHRGKKYAGPDKSAAIAKLKKIYESQGWDLPSARSIEIVEQYNLQRSMIPGEAIRMAGETIFTGYAFLWPKDKREKDLYNTYFLPTTNYGFDEYRNQPIYYQHGMNPDVDLEKIGKVISQEIDNIGLWVKGELRKSSKYWASIRQLIDQKKLFLSPGSASHLIRYGEDGSEVRSYPIIEQTLTPTPGQPRLLPVDFLRSVGIDVDGATDGRGTDTEPNGGAVRQERIARNTETNHVSMEDSVDEKEIQARVDAAVRAYEEGRLKAEQEAKLAADKEKERLAAEEKRITDLVDARVAAIRASLPVDQTQRPGYQMRSQGQFNIMPGSALGEFSYLKAVRGIVLSFWGKPNPWSGSEKERDILTKYADEVRSSPLSENIGNLGAYLVPPQYIQEQFIPLLRARSVVRGANPVIMQVNSNVAYIPSQTGGATAYWVGENATITASNLTVGQVALTIKKLAGLEYVSNELLADSNPSVDQIMRQDLMAVLALAEDKAYLTSDGTANAPVGMPNLPGVTLLTCASDSGNGGALQAKDLFLMKLNMMKNNIPNDNWSWFCSTRTWDSIAQLQDSNKRYLLETLTGGNIAQYPAYGTYPQGPETSYLGSVVGRLLGWPVYVTTNIPETDTQGSSSTATKLYLVRMSDVVIAERAGLELMATNVAGTAFATDQTWIRAIMRVGFTVRHAPAVTIMQGLTG